MSNFLPAERAHSLRSTLKATVLALALGSGLATVPVALADPAPVAPAAPAPATAVDQQIADLLKAPIPQDIDGLLAHMREISRVAGATNEEVNQTALDLDKARSEVQRAGDDVERTKREASEALRRLNGSRASVGDVAQAQYRGAVIDPISAVAGARGPQAAIDRGAYIASLANKNDRLYSALDKDLHAAALATNQANRAKFRADFRVNDLDAKQRKLDNRTNQLNELKKRVTDTVNGLSPADRQRWIDINGPVNVNVPEIMGRINAASGDHSGVVGAAMSKLGAPYGWGAAGPNEFDCSGLMMWAYQQMGKTIPRTSQAQLAGGTPVSRDQLQPGDIVAYYPGATHVGMYIGDGKLVHASDYGIPVQVVPVDSMPMVGAARY